MNNAPVIIFLGQIGSGKTVQAAKLANTLKADHFSIGSLIRQKHLNDDRTRRGELLPDELVNDVVREEINAVDPTTAILIDGFPRRVTQKKWLDQFLRKTGRDNISAVYLKVSDEEVDKRLSARGREDDNPPSIAARKEIFAQEIKPVLEAYSTDEILHTIDGEGDIETIHEHIVKELNL